MNGDEIVRYIVTETLAAASTPQTDVRHRADELVTRFLREFGGAQVYLPQQDREMVRQSRARIFAVALSSTEPMHVIAQREGISRVTLYRLLKRGPPSSTSG